MKFSVAGDSSGPRAAFPKFLCKESRDCIGMSYNWSVRNDRTSPGLVHVEVQFNFGLTI
jgi:hypothetical protein